MRIVLLGAPGSGKGTQAKLICHNFNLPHISTGDIFRFNISEKTPLGMEAESYMKKGELVPDSLTISMVEDRLKKEDSCKGFVLDGFPRNISQAESLEEILKEKGQRIDKMLLIDVPEFLIAERAAGRQVCRCCGASYHLKFSPSKVQGKCDLCQGDLYQREDDKAETVKSRVDLYNDSIQPIINYYGDGGPLLVINGVGEISDIYDSVQKALKVN